VDNILEYMAASDFLLHPSLAESSCVVVKEAGLAQLPVIVCRGVGDFDSYLIHERNAFTVDAEEFVDEATEAIINNFSEKDRLVRIAAGLRKTILEKFSIDSVINQYEILNKI
jgi:glycosyltransferase involved in cell wall biosynthesis